MSNPLVSIVMPAFLRDTANLGYFREALESALAQTYEPVEILVVNDGSPLTQALEDLVRLFGPRVRYIKKDNGGVASALNVAIREMKGSYFTWLSHDDLYEPNKVSAQMAQMMNEKDEVILYCDVEHVDSSGKHIFFETTIDLEPKTSRVFFAQYGAHNANAHLIPRQCFDVVGQFNESLRTTQDNDMWFRLSKHFDFKRVPQVLIKYRNHPTQDSRSPSHLRECNALFVSFLDNLERVEIIEHAGRTPARYYSECACVRRNRGYGEAAKHAVKLASWELLLHPIVEWPNRNFVVGQWFHKNQS
jgi:glycosyltransferase involved in cell wall biosynthesis